MLFFAGVWLLTAAETPAGATRSPRQRALRWFAVMPALYGIALFIQGLLYYWRYQAMARLAPPAASWPDVIAAYQPYLDAIGYIAYAFFPLATLPLPVLLFMHLAWLGKRLLSRQLAEHSAIVGIGLSAALALAALTTALVRHAETLFGPHWASRSNAAIALELISSTTAALFALWSLYLIIRFAIAFALEGRALRRLWREADRSATVEPAGN
jgi:hypothetical protein